VRYGIRRQDKGLFAAERFHELNEFTGLKQGKALDDPVFPDQSFDLFAVTWVGGTPKGLLQSIRRQRAYEALP
jgi:hypothetical protein